MMKKLPRPYIIAEVAQSHDGSLGQAHAFIDAVATTNANAIKFQTHIADAESTLEEPWRVNFSYQDDSRYAYWKRMEFSQEQWMGLKRHAERCGLDFLSSPFSVDAVNLLDRIGVGMWKVASGEVSNPIILDAMVSTRKPIFVSSGLSTWIELDETVAKIREKGLDFSVMQCTSEYPCSPEKWGLNIIDELRNRYQCPVGFSDHSGTIYPSLAAISLGASILEVHVTLSPFMFGPDVLASVSLEQLADLVKGCNLIQKSLKSPIDKDNQAASASKMRQIFGQVLMCRKDMLAGTVLSIDVLTAKKANGGIPVADIKSVLGRKLKYNIAKNTAIQYNHLFDQG